MDASPLVGQMVQLDRRTVLPVGAPSARPKSARAQSRRRYAGSLFLGYAAYPKLDPPRPRLIPPLTGDTPYPSLASPSYGALLTVSGGFFVFWVAIASELAIFLDEGNSDSSTTAPSDSHQHPECTARTRHCSGREVSPVEAPEKVGSCSGVGRTPDAVCPAPRRRRGCRSRRSRSSPF